MKYFFIMACFLLNLNLLQAAFNFDPYSETTDHLYASCGCGGGGNTHDQQDIPPYQD